MKHRRSLALLQLPNGVQKLARVDRNKWGFTIRTDDRIPELYTAKVSQRQRRQFLTGHLSVELRPVDPATQQRTRMWVRQINTTGWVSLPSIL